MAVGKLFFASPLTPQALDSVAAWKYVPCTTTPLDDALQPLWNYLIEFLPLWLAPNCVTFLGLAPMVAVYGCFCATCANLEEPVPRWQLVTFSVASLFYFAMDNLDGKQARRTGSSSPLGHLVDHGVDALTVVPYHAFVIVGALGVGSGRLLIVTQLVVQISFCLAQWQERYTMVCPNAGISEMCLLGSALVFGAGVLDPAMLRSIWCWPITAEFDVRAAVLCALFINGVAYMAFFVAKTLHCAHRQGSTVWALLELLPMAAHFGSAFVWSPDSIDALALPIFVLVGIVSFFLTMQMIVFSMAKSPCPLFQPVFILYSVLAIASRFVPLNQLMLALKAGLVFVAFAIGWWLLRVVAQIKQRLGVQVFRIGRKRD